MRTLIVAEIESYGDMDVPEVVKRLEGGNVRLNTWSTWTVGGDEVVNLNDTTGRDITIRIEARR